ncbi:hypothetical protein [Streptomyces mirabilis]|uniref:hypothetical protein n=1 Tax=Streptomyces mirabilis TaxID=68239 RepID=UPI00369DF45A
MRQSQAARSELLTHWCLMRMVSKEPGSSDAHALAYIRDLREGEKEALDEALSLLKSFSSNWEGNVSDLSYKRFIEVFNECAAGMQKASGHLSENDRAMLSRAAIEAADAISSWPRKILSQEYERLGVDPGSRERIEGVAKKLLTEEGIIFSLHKVAGSRNDSLVAMVEVSGEGRRHFIAHFCKEILQESGVPHADNWIVQEVLTIGLSQLQYLAATVLKTYRAKIEESGHVILSLYGETLYGHPVLVPKEDLSKLGGRTDVSFVPIEKPNLEGVLRAADAAEKFLNNSEDEKSQRVATAVPDTAPARPEKENKAGDDAKDPPEASDLASLLLYVSRLSTDLEKRWSSLIVNEGSETQKEALNRWYSFISSLKSHIEKQDRRDTRSALLGRFPLKAEDFKPDTDVSEMASSLNEAAIAELYAVRNLVNVMQGLQRPTAVQIDLVTGDAAHWWESGAFHSVQRAADVAMRVVRRRDQLIELEETQDSSPSQFDKQFTTADIILHANLSRAAMNQGLPEASILYCALALRGIAVRFGAEGDSPEQAASAIGSGPRSVLREPAEQVMTLVQNIASGAGRPLERIVNLANFWYHAIGPLVESALTQIHPQDEEAG